VVAGAAVRWLPANPDSNWPLKAPRIGGNPLPASDEDMVKLQTTGIWTNGGHLRSPMPQFRMDRNDAEAVVAYLKSIPSNLNVPIAVLRALCGPGPLFRALIPALGTWV
jgi:hypothetical protein